MKLKIRGREIETGRLVGITVRVEGVELAALSALALYELRRNFASSARKFRHSVLGAKKRVRRGVDQIAHQLAAEAERRGCPEPRASAAPLTLIFGSVEDAGCLVAFLEGLEQVYLSERAKIAEQGQVERAILFECAQFCGTVAAGIKGTELEVN